MPFGLETIYGIAFLAAMAAIGAGLTWAGMRQDLTTTESAEAAD